MTKRFSIFQVNSSEHRDAAITLMNGFGDIAKTASEMFEKDIYDLAAFIHADNLDQVFEYGNIGGPEGSIKPMGRMRSVSVGDLIWCTEDKKMHIVSRLGFEEVALG